MTIENDEDATFRKLKRLPFLDLKDEYLVTTELVGNTKEIIEAWLIDRGWSWIEFAEAYEEYFEMQYNPFDRFIASYIIKT